MDFGEIDQRETSTNELGSSRELEGVYQVNVKVLYYERDQQRIMGGRSPHVVALQVPTDATVATLAGKVSTELAQHGRESQVSGGSAPPLRLFHLGKELRDWRRSLSSLGLQSGCSLSAIAGELSSTLRIEELVPSSCSEAGGVEVHIQGKNFLQSPGHPFVARFGFVVVPATPITEELARCVAPPHAPGVVAVDVSNGGMQFTEDRILFTYVAHTDSGTMAFPVWASNRHCASVKTAEEIERAAMPHHREF